jgi:hypothetical protein
MKCRKSILLVIVLGLGMLPNSAYALDSGWNRYSNSEFNLMFEYPGFLNDLEEIGTQMGQQGGDTSTPIMNTWVFENRKWTINLSQSDESRSQIIMSVSIYDNPDGLKMIDCALALAINELARVGEGAARIDFDSLVVANLPGIHARSWIAIGSGGYKYANLYAFGANGRVFAISICDACMKSVLTDQFGDYNSVVDRILRSLRWIE